MSNPSPSAPPSIVPSSVVPSSVVPSSVVFLFDVDDTLLDNDAVTRDIDRHLTGLFDAGAARRYWEIYEELRGKLGYADYLGAVQSFRLECGDELRAQDLAAFVLDYPFKDRLYPGALAAIAHLARFGQCVVLSDGDVVLQPRKVAVSGIAEAVGGRVLIYVHKERMLDDVARRYPADHYVMMDDKLRVLDGMHRRWRDRLTTVFVRQGHYAADPAAMREYPPAHISVDGIGELQKLGPDAFRVSSTSTSVMEQAMNTTRQLHDLGQSIWLDNITRGILDDGTLAGYVARQHVTGLTSNPSIFDKAISGGHNYDDAIATLLAEEQHGEDLFFSLALQDLTRAADLFRPAFDASKGVDGYVSLEVSPLLADDTHASIESAVALHGRAHRDNLFIKIPGTPAGVPAIEESIYRGIPINVTLLFSREQYIAAAEAWMRGVERRIAEGKDPSIDSVASVFVSRWDVAVADKVPAELKDRLGIAIAQRTYKAYCELRETPRWKKIIAAGVHPQRLLWASTGTKDPKASDTLYVEALAAPDTINTIPDKTLLAFADHGKLRGVMARDGGDCEEVIARFRGAGIDDAKLAARLQQEGAEKFVKAWNDLLGRLAQKSTGLASQAKQRGARA